LAVIWGGTLPLIKLGLRDFPPLTLTTLRYAVAAPFFALLLRKRPLPPPRAVAATAGLGVGIGAGQVAQTFGIHATAASVAAVISSTIPILVVVFAAIRLRQRVRARHAAGLVLAFAGISLVATGDPRRLVDLIRTRAFAGDLLILISAVAIALYYVLSVELIQRYSVITVAAISSIAGAAVLTPFAAWELRTAPVNITATGVAIVLYLAVLVTVIGIQVWLRALERMPASLAAAMQYLQPVVGIAASAAIFGDPLGVWFVAGTGLVFLGIAWSTTAHLLEWRTPA